MCMLCVIPPGIIPSREKLTNSALNNPHGFGFAIVVPQDRRIIVEKTMDADESINNFLKLRGQYPEGYAMWHARLATHGSQTVDNCHPFAVGHDPQTYLGHNGILPVLEDKTDRSDTRIFAEDILSAMGGVTALDNEQLYNMLEDFTTGSKVCVLTVDPRAQHQAYLLHEEKGKYDTTGVWWSNDSCYLSDWSSSKWVSNKDYDLLPASKDEIIECFNCKSTLDEEMIDTYEGQCFYCGACTDCKSTATECLCYDATGNKWWTYDAPHSKPVSLWGEW